MNQYDVAIVGGDRRTAYMAPILAGEGFQVICYAVQDGADASHPLSPSINSLPNITCAATLKEALDTAGTVVCGIPFQKDGFLYNTNNFSIPLPELQRCLRKRQKIFGGMIPEDFQRLCEEREIGCYDFLQNEPLTLSNAAATAEGAILEALKKKETVLHKSNCLVLGFGRCGSLIARKLKGLDAQVTIAAGNPAELALADAHGYSLLPLAKIKQEITVFEYIFNTIPACYLDEKCLRMVSANSLIIDIASGKTGVDYKAAAALGTNVHFCPGLPGKYSSISCANQLSKFVISNIHPKKKGV